MRSLTRLALLLLAATVALAQETLPPDMRASIDKAANEILAKTGAPSASIAVVKDGKIAYVHAGMIFERASGMPLVDFLQQRVFGPLAMTSVFNTDVAALPETDAMRYLRYAAGPLRVAPKEGKGWMYAAGELAMTASDLAKWDISIIDQTTLKPESYRDLEHELEHTSGDATP